MMVKMVKVTPKRMLNEVRISYIMIAKSVTAYKFRTQMARSVYRVAEKGSVARRLDKLRL